MKKGFGEDKEELGKTKVVAANEDRSRSISSWKGI